MFGRMLITDYTGVYQDEGFMETLTAGGYDYVRLDLSGLEGTKCFCSEDAADAIRSALEPQSDCRIHWIDSGDYHYMTYFFCERIRTPFTLLLVDHHPDDQDPIFEDVLSCGGWVSALKRNQPFLQEVIPLGVGGVFPEARTIAGPVYVSLDKDVFSPLYARTDWSQGTSSPEEVFGLLDAFLSQADAILGFDICGELPAQNGGKQEDFKVNHDTNLFIINKLEKLFI